MKEIAIIIVTHNSQRYLSKAIQCLVNTNHSISFHQTIIIVDSGSRETAYLEPYINQTQSNSQTTIKVILTNKNIGFCQGNNLGMQYISSKTDYILFLNPDAFIFPNFIRQALEFMEKPLNQKYGAITGELLGYDINADKPTGTYDSTGIFCTWYGKWYDRNQKESIQSKKTVSNVEEIPAICGALMFCRKRALDQVLVNGKEVMDSSFYMYKEDIDLSLRLRKAKWKLAIVHAFKAYHCRGWQDRTSIPKKLRLHSAMNELKIHWRIRSYRMIYSFTKFLYVKWFNG